MSGHRAALKKLREDVEARGFELTFRWKHRIATAEVRKGGKILGCGHATGPMVLIEQISTWLKTGTFPEVMP